MNGRLSRRQILAVLATAAALGGAAGRAVAAAAGSVALTGRVVVPGDAGYDAARAVWNGIFDTHPLAIVYCESADDVRNAVAWSRQNGVAIRARSGGHSLEGWSSIDGGLVLDVSAMKQVAIDASAKTATLGPGLTQGEVVAALGAVGSAVPTGSEASVGLAGVTLGGGIGFLSRSLGLTCDSLTAVEIVVPDGTDGAALIRADEVENSDLLWACRGGGGGNFGVVTSLTFRIHPVEAAMTRFRIGWDWSDPVAAFNAWQAWAPSADPRVGSTFVFLPQAANALEVEGLYRGPEDELAEMLVPLTSVGSPNVRLDYKSWPDHYIDMNPPGRSFANWRFTSSWAYEPLPPQAIATVLDFMERAPAPACNYWCLSWGGATMTEPVVGSAFPHRSALYYAEPGAGWNDPDQTAPVAVWLAAFRQAMRPFVSGGYVNVPDAAVMDWGEAYYGKHFRRLRAVKSIYDPGEVCSGLPRAFRLLSKARFS